MLEVAVDYRHKNEAKFNQDFLKNVEICKTINKDSTFELLPNYITSNITSYVLLTDLKHTSHAESVTLNNDELDKEDKDINELSGLMKNCALDSDI